MVEVRQQWWKAQWDAAEVVSWPWLTVVVRGVLAAKGGDGHGGGGLKCFILGVFTTFFSGGLDLYAADLGLSLVCGSGFVGVVFGFCNYYFELILAS